VLSLLVVMICKCSINPITDPNSVYSHSTRDSTVTSIRNGLNKNAVKIFRSIRDEVKANEENYIMRSFASCSAHAVLLYRAERDWRGVYHARRDNTSVGKAVREDFL
jgi:hypothetical protein